MVTTSTYLESYFPLSLSFPICFVFPFMLFSTYFCICHNIVVTIVFFNLIYWCGETGIRIALKMQRSNPYEFESRHQYQGGLTLIGKGLVLKTSSSRSDTMCQFESDILRHMWM